MVGLLCLIMGSMKGDTMNNPHNKSHAERAITPKANFGKGINCGMSKARRLKKKMKARTH